MAKPLWTLLLWVAIASSQTAGLPSKETLSYDIEWRLITAGKAQMQWTALDGPAGSQVHLHVESAGFVSKLFKVEDDYTSLLTDSLCAESAEMRTHEGTRRRQTKITFDAERHKAVYEEHDLGKNTTVGPREIDIPPCVHDVIGGIYVLRGLKLEPGQSTELPVSDGKKSAMVKVEAQQREEVKTPAGMFRTVRYEVYLFNNVLYRRSAHLHVWLTEDASRIPVQIRVRMPFTIGTITLALEQRE